MRALQKTRTLLKIDRKTKRLFTEAFFYLGWARILLLLPFSRVAGLLGAPMQETPNRSLPNEASLVEVHDAIRVVSRHTPWDCKCLVRAIAAQSMLGRRQVESTLYLGTTRDAAGHLIAHAWLRSGPFYITGAEEMERFAAVAKFAKWVKPS